MDASDFEAIVAARDLAAAEAAREHAGPHSVTLSSLYWRTQDWLEKSLVVHMVQDQRGPHLRSMFTDFLRAPEPEPAYRDHVELTKAVCLVQLKGTPGLFEHYSNDREALRRDVELETGGVTTATAAPRLLGTPTPIAAPKAERPRKVQPPEPIHALAPRRADNSAGLLVLVVAAVVGVLVVAGAVVAVLLLGG